MIWISSFSQACISSVKNRLITCFSLSVINKIKSHYRNYMFGDVLHVCCMVWRAHVTVSAQTASIRPKVLIVFLNWPSLHVFPTNYSLGNKRVESVDVEVTTEYAENLAHILMYFSPDFSIFNSYFLCLKQTRLLSLMSFLCVFAFRFCVLLREVLWVRHS